nr:leucine zipper putative tumor suppressor 2-like [Ipomoea batatas]
MKKQRPAKTRALNNATVKISAEAYEYNIFRSAEEYSNAKLEPPRYDLTEKYTPKRAVVTVAVGPPSSETGSSAAMRSFSVFAGLLAPTTKINLGSKKNNPPKTGNSGVEAPVPTRLPLTATHPASPNGEKLASRIAKRVKEKEVLKRVKELESKLKTAKETGKRVLEWPELSEKLLTDFVILAKHICRGRETGEAVLAAVSRTPIGEHFMYEFGTWAFTSGRRAIQNDVRAALEALVDEDYLPKLLVVLPENVPDPRPTPFSKIPDKQASDSVAGASARPTTEAVTELGVETAKGDE